MVVHFHFGLYPAQLISFAADYLSDIRSIEVQMQKQLARRLLSSFSDDFFSNIL